MYTNSAQLRPIQDEGLFLDVTYYGVFFRATLGEFGQKSFIRTKMYLIQHLCAAPPRI